MTNNQAAKPPRELDEIDVREFAIVSSKALAADPSAQQGIQA